MPFKIVRNDIVKMNTEAIVNTANSEPMSGTGCDIAIYTAAGYDTLLKYRKEKIGYVEEGEVFITPGFNLSAKYIIHAVSPMYVDGKSGEEEKLRSCYKKSLELANENNIKSIAFPLIATGGFGYPKEEGMRIALDEINAFLLKNDMDIQLVVFGSTDTMLGEKLYPDLEAYIDHNYVSDKRRMEYGDRYYGSISRSDRRYNAYDLMRNEMEDRIEKRMQSKRSNIQPEDASAPTILPKSEIEKKFKDRERFSRFKPSEKKEIKAAPRVENFLEADLCAAYNAVEDDDYDELLAPHTKKLKERMEHMADTFSEYLLFLINEKGLTNADVYKKAIVDKKTFSKIKNNKDWHPQKKTALCLCIGAKLNLDESKDLLARAGYALSPCDKTDIIFSYFIENKIYNMIDLDLELEEHGLEGIIS